NLPSESDYRLGGRIRWRGRLQRGGVGMNRAHLAILTMLLAAASSGLLRGQAPAAGASRKPSAPTASSAPLGIGRTATPAEIAAWDDDVMPDGTGLPPGSGTPAAGAAIFASRCAGCHGKSGKEGPNDVLVGAEPRQGFPFSKDPSLPQPV